MATRVYAGMKYQCVLIQQSVCFETETKLSPVVHAMTGGYANDEMECELQRLVKQKFIVSRLMMVGSQK